MDEYVRGYDNSDYVFFDATAGSGSPPVIIINGNSDWQNTVWRVLLKKIMLRTVQPCRPNWYYCIFQPIIHRESDVINDGAIGSPAGSFDSMGLDLTNSYFDDKMSADGTTVSFYANPPLTQQMSWRSPGGGGKSFRGYLQMQDSLRVELQ